MEGSRTYQAVRNALEIRLHALEPGCLQLEPVVHKRRGAEGAAKDDLHAYGCGLESVLRGGTNEGTAGQDALDGRGAGLCKRGCHRDKIILAALSQQCVATLHKGGIGH